MKETIINYLLAGAMASGLGVGKYYADHTYISMNAYQQTNTQNRVWSLQDQIKNIQRKAAREGRALTTLELQDIKELQIEVNNLEK